MAFTDSKPASANTILSDVVAMEANAAFLKDTLENFVGTWSDSSATGIFPAKVNRTNTSDATYTVLAADTILEANTSGANVELNLQAVALAGEGRIHVIKKVHASNLCVIDPNGVETIDGSADSRNLSEDNEVMVLYCTGTTWEIIFHDKPIAHQEERRSTFAWSSTSAITLTPFVYRHNGTMDQYVYSDADITFTLGSGGSNGDSDDLDTDKFHYIYIDDSALSGNVITNAQLLNDSTAPTWVDSKGGWYRGDDRCIFAIYSNSSDQVDSFQHDGGDYIAYPSPVDDQAYAALLGSTAVTLTAPGFASRTEIVVQLFSTNYADSITFGYAASPTGILYLRSSQDGGVRISLTAMATTIYFDESDVAGGNVGVRTLGWYLPIGF